jgi:hypothetical protein
MSRARLPDRCMSDYDIPAHSSLTSSTVEAIVTLVTADPLVLLPWRIWAALLTKIPRGGAS